MNEEMTLEISSYAAEQTFDLGLKIGRNLRGGELIDLVGDIGGGKTVFVRGLALGIGSNDQVASPTFTISRQYRSSPDRNLVVHHFDFYRLEDPGIMAREIAESLANPRVVVVVEWSGSVQQVLPDEKMQLTIAITGEEGRLLHVAAPASHQHLLKGLV